MFSLYNHTRTQCSLQSFAQHHHHHLHHNHMHRIASAKVVSGSGLQSLMSHHFVTQDTRLSMQEFGIWPEHQ